MSAINLYEVKLENERLNHANEILMGEIKELKDRIAHLEKMRGIHLHLATKRAKKLEAIQMILDEEWELDTSEKTPKIVKGRGMCMTIKQIKSARKR